MPSERKAPLFSLILFISIFVQFLVRFFAFFFIDQWLSNNLLKSPTSKKIGLKTPKTKSNQKRIQLIVTWIQFSVIWIIFPNTKGTKKGAEKQN